MLRRIIITSVVAVLAIGSIRADGELKKEDLKSALKDLAASFTRSWSKRSRSRLRSAISSAFRFRGPTSGRLIEAVGPGTFRVEGCRE